MIVILIAMLVVLLWLGGGNRLSAYLMPSIDPHIGAWLIIALVALSIGLLLPPTRMLVSAAVIYSVRGLIVGMTVLAQGLFYAGRLILQSVRMSWRALRRSRA